MGDRCHVHGYVRKTDWDEFADTCDIQHEFDDEPALYPGLVHFEEYDRNYGMHDELQDAADRNLAFVVYNSAGGSYECAVTVAIDGGLYTHMTDTNGRLVVPFTPDNVGGGCVLVIDVDSAREVAGAIHRVLTNAGQLTPARARPRAGAREVQIE